MTSSSLRKKTYTQAAARADQPRQKKHLGQHFLIAQEPINTMLSAIKLTPETTVVEIGCGNGILSKAILESPCKALHIVEIDPEWASYIDRTIDDPRLTIHLADAVQFDFTQLKTNGPLVLMANLPYLITFPLFEAFTHHHDLFDDAIVMIQEEAAERITHSSGRRCGAVSLFLQHYFHFTNYEKVPPHFFSPAPKVVSRLVRFQGKKELMPIAQPREFWSFVQACFKSPRQTLANNLKRTSYAWQKLSAETLRLRAQQLSVAQLHELFTVVA